LSLKYGNFAYACLQPATMHSHINGGGNVRTVLPDFKKLYSQISQKKLAKVAKILAKSYSQK